MQLFEVEQRRTARTNLWFFCGSPAAAILVWCGIWQPRHFVMCQEVRNERLLRFLHNQHWTKKVLHVPVGLGPRHTGAVSILTLLLRAKSKNRHNEFSVRRLLCHCKASVSWRPNKRWQPRTRDPLTCAHPTNETNLNLTHFSTIKFGRSPSAL